LVNNKTVIEAGEEMLALTDPVSPKFVREFVLGTIHAPIPEDFLSRLVSESLKVPARVWRDYYEGGCSRPMIAPGSVRSSRRR
jgi:hypothetical protein